MPEYTWAERRPSDGQRIEVWSAPKQKWYPGTYSEDGVDGLVTFDDGDLMEVEEYGRDTMPKWRIWSN